MLVQSQRNKHAALKLMRKLLKRYAFVPERLVTDDLRSYGAAVRELGIERRHERRRWKNNRAERYPARAADQSAAKPDQPDHCGQALDHGRHGLRLGHWFRNSPEFWLNLQTSYDLRVAEQAVGKEIEALPVMRDWAKAMWPETALARFDPALT